MAINKKTMFILIIVVAVMFMYSSGGSIGLSLDNATGDGSGSGGSGGGGGGGSSGDGSAPDGGFVCDTCDTEFLVGNPGVVTSSYTTAPLKYYFPFVVKPEGHWNCVGECVYNGVVQSDYNCVIDPTHEIPDGGYDDITGEQPQCYCLKKNPGSCQWYDANYGGGIDDLQCGGSCPPGEVCTTWKENGKEVCDCLAEEEEPDCEFHMEDILTGWGDPSLQDYESACYGACPYGDECIFWVDKNNQPYCDCDGTPPEDEIMCDQIDASNPFNCWTQGICANIDNECVYNQYTKNCECQGKDDCGWHITVEQAKQLIEQYGSIQGALGYIMSNNDLYCYGKCTNVGDKCYASVVQEGFDYYYDCSCKGGATTTTTTLRSPSPDFFARYI